MMLNMNVLKTIKKSFRRVKEDIETLRENTDEWIQFLDGDRREMRQRILFLEQRLRDLETEHAIRNRRY